MYSKTAITCSLSNALRALQLILKKKMMNQMTQTMYSFFSKQCQQTNLQKSNGKILVQVMLFRIGFRVKVTKLREM